jgi:hypothetical protein
MRTLTARVLCDFVLKKMPNTFVRIRVHQPAAALDLFIHPASEARFTEYLVTG